jgi:hypothetical protein
LPEKHFEITRPEYYVQTGSMFENPHGVDPREIVGYILENPAEIVAQVVFGKYVESSGLVFTGEQIKQMIDYSLPPVRGNFWVDEHALEQAKLEFLHRRRWGHRYHTGIDFARQTDYTVISTIDTIARPARLVYWKRLNRVPWEHIYAEVGRAAHLWGRDIYCDGTGPGGDVVMDALHSRRYCPLHHRCNLGGQSCVDGKGAHLGCDTSQYISLAFIEDYDFGGGTGLRKKELVEHLRNVLSVGYDVRNPDEPFGWLRIPPIEQIEEELTFYTWDDKRLTTDALFSLALACWSGLEDCPRPSSIGSIYA